MFDFNIWAAVVAGVSAFVLGGLWYSPALFGKAWLKANNMTEADAQNGHPGMVFGLSFILAVVAAGVFAWFLGPNPDLKRAVISGAVIGLAYVSTSFGINYLFSQRSLSLFLIDAGYHTAQFVIYGLILGLWH